MSVRLRRTALAGRRLGRRELRPFAGRDDGRPEAELHVELYRQATNRSVGISAGTATFLEGFFAG